MLIELNYALICQICNCTTGKEYIKRSKIIIQRFRIFCYTSGEIQNTHKEMNLITICKTCNLVLTLLIIGADSMNNCKYALVTIVLHLTEKCVKVLLHSTAIWMHHNAVFIYISHQNPCICEQWRRSHYWELFYF